MDKTLEHLLLSEQSHRMANGMGVAVGALRAVERRMGCDPALSATISRLGSEAEVHRLLCARPIGLVVDLVEMLARLCRAMASACPDDAAVVAPVSVAMPVRDDDARLIALAVHELVANAIRHACASGGTVAVEIVDQETVTVIVVRDTGAALSWSRAGGQGAGIVDGLADCLGGQVIRSSHDDGGSVELRLPRLAVRTELTAARPTSAVSPPTVLA
jgi:two-component sensor histidine kinase